MRRAFLRYVAAGAFVCGGAEITRGEVVLDVLFVGNSFTHGYDPVLRFNRDNISDLNNAGNNRQGGVPGIFKALASSGGYQVNVSIEALSGAALADHLATKSAVIGQSK